MTDILLSDTNSTAINQLINKAPHALLINGQKGVGKTYVAEYIASELLRIDQSKLTTYPYFYPIEPEGKSISIDTIRVIRQKLSLKIPSDKIISRVVLISHADTLTQESQNALLKILEEPPKDTVIIMTTNDRTQLLDTILSRLTQLTVDTPLNTKTSQFFISKGYSESEIENTLRLSNGRVGLMQALLNNQDHPLVQAIEEAKSILGMKRNQRLIHISKLKDKEQILQLLDALALISSAALHNSLQSGDQSVSKRWHTINKQTFYAKQAIQKNAQSKLVLTDLMLTM